MTYDLTTLSGTPAYTVSSKFVQALNSGVLVAPTGADSFLGTTTGAALGTGTYECWFKSVFTSGTRVIICHPGRFFMYTSGGAGISVNYGSESVVITGGAAMNNGAWHHAAFVLNGGQGSLNLDGNLVASSATVGHIASDSGQGLAVGGFSGKTTFNFASSGVGTVDEVRISTSIRYSGATYTVPTAAFTADAFTNALYHLDGDGSDSAAGAIILPTIGSIHVSTSGGIDTITYPAPTAGTNAIGGVNLYVAASSGGYSAIDQSNSGAGAGSFTHATPSSGQYFYAIAPSDSSGYLGGLSNEVSTGTPTGMVAFDPTNAGLVYSPYTWDVSTSRAIGNPGAYLKTLVAGSVIAITLVFDVSDITVPPPQIAYRVDRTGPWTVVSVAQFVALAIPSSTASCPKHLVEVVVKSRSLTGNTWNSPYQGAVKLQKVFATTGASLVAPTTKTLRGLILGDSITEGVNTTSLSGDSTLTNDSMLGWAYELGELLGAEVGVKGWGGQGLIVNSGSAGTVPTLPNTYDKFLSGLSYSLSSPVPDFIAINIGTNDQRQGGSSTTFQSTYISFLNTLLSLYTFDDRHIRDVPTWWALRPYAIPKRCGWLQHSEPGGADRHNRVVEHTSDSSDSLHPYGYINQAKLGPLTAAAIRTGLNRGSTFLIKAGGIAQSIGPKRL